MAKKRVYQMCPIITRWPKSRTIAVKLPNDYVGVYELPQEVYDSLKGKRKVEIDVGASTVKGKLPTVN
jgi:hypothetical protein